MNKPKIGIISSVPANPFANLPFEQLGFGENEKTAALTPEVELFLNPLDKQYRNELLTSGVQFDIIRAMDNQLPNPKDYDAYILGGSPAMVGQRDEKPWIDSLIKFTNKTVNSGTPVMGLCFGHQVLVTAFGGQVADMQDRFLGPAQLKLNELGKENDVFGQSDEDFVAMYSHKQSVVSPGEAEVVGSSSHDPYSMVKIGNDAYGAQFHPEFTKDTVTFLAKLMKDTLKNEGIDLQAILHNPMLQEVNNGSKIIQLFLKKYWNK